MAAASVANDVLDGIIGDEGELGDGEVAAGPEEEEEGEEREEEGREGGAVVAEGPPPPWEEGGQEEGVVEAEVDEEEEEEDELVRRLDEQLGRLDARFDESVRRLEASIDSYMQTVTPPSFVAPIKCKVIFQPSGATLDVSLRATDLISDVWTIYSAQMQRANSPVVHSGDHLRYYLRRGGGGPPEEVSAGAFVSDLDIDPGTVIVVEGPVTIDSPELAKCFGLTFIKGTRMDYFRCIDCLLNWVCEPCSRNCHQGHRLESFMPNHLPSYACCHCPRKECVIENKKSAKKRDSKHTSSSTAPTKEI